MRKILLPLFIGAAIISSCRKEGCMDAAATNYNVEAEKDNGSCEYGVLNPTPSPSPSSQVFIAKVDGTHFNTVSYLAKYITSTKMLQIIGKTSGNEETIVLSMMHTGDNSISSFDNLFARTYDFNSANLTFTTGSYIASAQYNKYNYTLNGYETWQTDWDYIQIGEIKVAEVSGNHIKGSFFVDVAKSNGDGTFDALNVKHITTGTFDMDVTIQ